MTSNSLNKYQRVQPFQDSKFTCLFSLTAFIFLLFLALFLSSCKNNKEVLFTGWVVNQQAKPISNALVKINNDFVRTSSDGSFKLNVDATKEFLISAKHINYADLFRISRLPLKDQVLVLPDASVKEVDPTNAITLVDDRSVIDGDIRAGATFTLPANALVDENGNSPAGRIRGAISTLDLSNGEGPQDWGVRDNSGRDGFLVSYGAVYIEFSSTDGSTVYQLKNGVSGQLTLPVTPSMEAYTSTTPSAPFWYYNNKDGRWYEAGRSNYDPTTGSYKGTVNHLSTINTDIAKYENAACLAITLDPSIAAGHKLRIRYHSGGTPFGQVPTFVMNDPLNAAYRLPANTNVLLELLNSSDEVLSNLVVEDPAGTALVNTVVNTGPALAPGSNLWPPSPYTTCKQIKLKLGAPQVEIRINEQAPALLRDNPTDDYLTWAPTYAMAHLATPGASDVTVVLANDAPGIGGDVGFAAHASPWPVNTTATGATLTLTLPANGDWVPFMIAGKYGSPSIDDKDAIVEAHMNTATGTIIGNKALMVRVRKNGNTLSLGEKNRLLFAFQKFRNKVGGMNYVLAQEIHRLASQAGDEAHHQPAFLTWHRFFLLMVERELQKIDPSVALHYWDWDAASPNLFAADLIGASGSGGFTAEPDFSLTNPLLGWDTNLPFSGGELRRNTDDHTIDPGSSMQPLDDAIDPSLIDYPDYGETGEFGLVSSFSSHVERSSHDPAHGWPCAGGHLLAPSRSAADPLFYFLHCQIDREWAYWQQRHNRLGVVSAGVLTFPNPGHYENAGSWNSPFNTPDPSYRQKGSYLEDGIWPWDGTTGGAGVEQRPPNIGTGVGAAGDRPSSAPTIPATAFPASSALNLWPSVATIPLNKQAIDYLGRFNPLSGLGFCYDGVPY